MKTSKGQVFPHRQMKKQVQREQVIQPWQSGYYLAKRGGALRSPVFQGRGFFPSRRWIRAILQDPSTSTEQRYPSPPASPKFLPSPRSSCSSQQNLNGQEFLDSLAVYTVTLPNTPCVHFLALQRYHELLEVSVCLSVLFVSPISSALPLLGPAQWHFARPYPLVSLSLVMASSGAWPITGSLGNAVGQGYPPSPGQTVFL